ncbi:hypothetical protein PUP66_30085 [Pseudomonas chlororaphis]|uniref:hypothetical protein n=1 Tax=Pseudomonas chlororaphis TaxID=587753 RepID=UPI000E0B194F|nr:hypothetical protein [Pseudomonas chlororaphis]WDH47269.1 hypothetical protein PUP66_30085 [Pseudomonas chlororaphis]WDH59116.1 hypothetical protein PUP56_30090 [Pseudomonas chlororaphis]WQE18372.1 hypothetical protein U0007_28900 [Pseudomonas chlororaphis]
MSTMVKISITSLTKTLALIPVACRALCAGIRKRPQIITYCSEALAALGIVAAGATFVYDSWQARKVSLAGAVIYSTPSHMSLLVSNNGGVDLVIKRVQLTSGADVKSHVQINRNGLLVERGKSKILTSEDSELNSTVQYVEPDEVDSVFTRSITTPCQAVIEYVVAGEESKTATVDFICYAATLIGEKGIKWIEKTLEAPTYPSPPLHARP